MNNSKDNNSYTTERMSIGVGIITYRGTNHLRDCIPPLLNSPLKPKVVVFNTCKDDPVYGDDDGGTAELARELGVEVFKIPRTRMNHGWAREIMRQYLGTDIVVNMTPDAYAQDNMLEELVKPIVRGRASIAYARQIPHDGENDIGVFSRYFNYPSESNIRGIEDADRYGVYTIFCSDACAAWKSSALDEIGGFPWVLSAEDTIATAKLLKKGHKIAYVAEAVVKHSHNYGPKKEFIRHFDTGIYRRRWQSVLDVGSGGDESRGFKYAREMFKYLWKENTKLIPKAFIQLAMGWLGYKFGWYGYRAIPLWIKKKVSPADFFWFSKEFKEGMWDEPINSEKLLYDTEKHDLHVKK